MDLETKAQRKYSDFLLEGTFNYMKHNPLEFIMKYQFAIPHEEVKHRGFGGRFEFGRPFCIGIPRKDLLNEKSKLYGILFGDTTEIAIIEDNEVPRYLGIIGFHIKPLSGEIIDTEIVDKDDMDKKIKATESYKKLRKIS